MPLGFAFYFLADGHLGAFFADAVIAAVGRGSVFHLGWNDIFTGLLLGLMLMLPVIILAAAACVFPGRSKSSALRFMVAWTADAFGGVLATRGGRGVSWALDESVGVVVRVVFFAGRDNLASANEAAAMRGAGLGDDDRILFADRDLIVYLASGANPPKVVFHPLHLLCGFPLPDTASALAEFAQEPPRFHCGGKSPLCSSLRNPRTPPASR